MNTKSLLLIVPIVASIIFAGCSFEDVFSKLATSPEEQGARESYLRDQMLQQKQQKIADMTKEFTNSFQMTKVNESDAIQAVVFYDEGTPTKIAIEAILPNVSPQMYEVWLRNAQAKDSISIGVLQFNQTDDYSLSYEGDIDLNEYSNIILTREANPDTTPETIVMSGTFSPNADSTSNSN